MVRIRLIALCLVLAIILLTVLLVRQWSVYDVPATPTIAANRADGPLDVPATFTPTPVATREPYRLPTNTPSATQTPWVVTATPEPTPRIIEVTKIVIVVATSTPTP